MLVAVSIVWAPTNDEALVFVKIGGLRELAADDVKHVPFLSLAAQCRREDVQVAAVEFLDVVGVRCCLQKCESSLLFNRHFA